MTTKFNKLTISITLIIAILITIIVAIISATLNYNSYSDKERLLMASDNLTVNDGLPVSNNLSLPLKLNNDITVFWKSSDEIYLSSDGRVNRPRSNEGNIVIKLEATLFFNNYYLIKNFNIEILAWQSIATVMNDEGEKQITISNVYVSAINNDGFFVTDMENSIFIISEKKDIEIASIVTVTGLKTTKNYMHKIISEKIDVVSKGELNLKTIETSLEELQLYDHTNKFIYGVKIKVEGELSKSTSDEYYLTSNELVVSVHSNDDSGLNALIGIKLSADYFIYENSYNINNNRWSLIFNNDQSSVDIMSDHVEKINVINRWLDIVVPSFIDWTTKLNFPRSHPFILNSQIEWQSKNPSLINTSTDSFSLPNSQTVVVVTRFIFVDSIFMKYDTSFTLTSKPLVANDINLNEESEVFSGIITLISKNGYMLSSTSNFAFYIIKNYLIENLEIGDEVVIKGNYYRNSTAKIIDDIYYCYLINKNKIIENTFSVDYEDFTNILDSYTLSSYSQRRILYTNCKVLETNKNKIKFYHKDNYIFVLDIENLQINILENLFGTINLTDEIVANKFQNKTIDFYGYLYNTYQNES